MSGCRISKVRYKHAPNLTVLVPPPVDDGSIGEQEFDDFMRVIERGRASLFDGGKHAGGFIVMWDEKGRYVRDYLGSSINPVPDLLFPEFVRMAAQNILIDETACDVYNRTMFPPKEPC